MKSIIKNKNKKGLSEIIAYVMLVVMSLSLASGVYLWLKNSVPPDKETCSEDIALNIKNYTCNLVDHRITITVENKGFFSVSGFFIRASNKTDNLPTIPLAQESPLSTRGRYDAQDKLTPGEYETMSFLYICPENICPGKSYSINPLAKIQIQPYVLGTKTKSFLLCDKGIISQVIEGCT